MIRRTDRNRIQQFGRFVWARFIDDRCFETAGSLSYTTLVSLVPLAVAVLVMFSAFTMFAPARQTVLTFAFDNFVPAAGQQVQQAIQDFADHAKGLTGLSILVMLFSAVAMMVSIEDRLNRIWRVHAARSWPQRVLMYWAALTLGPILVFGGIATTSYVTAMPLLHGAVDQFSAFTHSLLSVLPFTVTLLTLWLMFWLIPNCVVPWRDAAIGALLGAVLFEIVRWGFTLFVHHAQTYQQIYGTALAVIPIFLLWIYLSWVIVILAASIAASVSAFDYRAPRLMLPERAGFLGVLAVLQQLADAHRAGQGMDLPEIRRRVPCLHDDIIADCLSELQHAGLARRGDDERWLLGRSLDSVELRRLYEHSRYRLPVHPERDMQALKIALSPRLAALLAETADAVSTRFAVPLDRVYPVAPAPAIDDQEPSP